MSKATTTATFTVSGMTCGSCVRRVRGAIEGLDGVTGVDVRLTGGVVAVTGDTDLDATAVRAAVAEAGYEVVA